ncbi:PAS domain S-box protein [Cupriavidus basilensis]
MAKWHRSSRLQARLLRMPAMEGTLARAVTNRPYLASGSPESGSYQAVSGSEGVERVFGYHRMPEFGLNFVVGESVGLVLAPYEVYRRVALAGAIASTLLLGLLYYSLRRSMAERRRHLEEMRLASLVYSSSSEAMVVTSLDGTIIDVNPAFAAATGYTVAEIKGRLGLQRQRDRECGRAGRTPARHRGSEGQMERRTLDPPQGWQRVSRLPDCGYLPGPRIWRAPPRRADP